MAIRICTVLKPSSFFSRNKPAITLRQRIIVASRESRQGTSWRSLTTPSMDCIIEQVETNTITLGKGSPNKINRGVANRANPKPIALCNIPARKTTSPTQIICRISMKKKTPEPGVMKNQRVSGTLVMEKGNKIIFAPSYRLLSSGIHRNLPARIFFLPAAVRPVQSSSPVAWQ